MDDKQLIPLINNDTKLRYQLLNINKDFKQSNNKLLIEPRVSSVLNKDTKSYGKQFLCDGKEETCWNSDQVLNFFILNNKIKYQ